MKPDDPIPSAVILVVDDEEDIRQLLGYALRQAGFTVLVSKHGQEALSLIQARSGKVDLVLSDVMMPELDGPMLARRLSEDWPAIPILFMTGYPAEMLASAELLPAGIPRIEKPFSMAALVRTIRSALQAPSS